MSYIDFTDGGAHVRTAFVAGNKTATAAGAGDNTLVAQDAWVGRKHPDNFTHILGALKGQAQHPRGMAQSAKLVISYVAVLAIGQTLSFAVQARDATDAAGAGAASVVDAVVPMTVVKTATAAGTFRETVEIDINLTGFREFVGFNITPDLSAGATDTVAWSAVAALFGDTSMDTRAIANVKA